MSRPYVELYIGDRQVEFTSPPEINITYTHEDLHNPTIIKNSFSKTVTIDATPRNNQIFGSYFSMRREVGYSEGKNTGAYFNPAKKVPFTLYRNGERVEHGYCKLDNIKRLKNSMQYNITLYGGLGQFLYNLQTKENGEKMKLSDLDYGKGDDDFILDVNKNTVRDAWNHINGEPVDYLYDSINFAPCYNGIPEDFSSDKVAIYADGFKFSDDLIVYNQLKTSIKDDGKTYTTVDGWMIGELSKEYDEWQMKDLRSYLQRPVIRFKDIVNACCNPVNNGGYTVDLDNDFFSKDNPYWEDAWMTLPLLTEIEDVRVANDEDAVVNIGETITISGITEGKNINITAHIAPCCMTESTANTLSTCCNKTSWDGSDESAIVDESTNFARYIQLVAYDADDRVIGGSNVLAFYTVNMYNSFDFEPTYNTGVSRVSGKYIKREDGTYRFNDATYDFKIGNLEYTDGMYLKIVEKFAYDSSPSVGTVSAYMLYENDMKGVAVTGYSNEIDDNVEVGLNHGMNWFISKKTFLNSEHSPCDYFLSYLKMFNLHIWQNDDDVIMVRLRDNYFTNERYDLENLIDRGSDIQINPLTFDAKWYNFSSEPVENALNKDYKDNYGLDYGAMKVDTNYNFDSSTKEIFKDSVFRSTITTRNKSKYYIDIYQSVDGDDAYYPPFMLDGCQTLLFSGSDTTEGAYLSPKTSIEGVNWWKDKYYDLFPKPCFADAENGPVEGANVLLFYAGKVEATDVDGNPMRIQISDDIPQFEVLNEGEPCWIWGYDWKYVITNMRYLPQFSRYKVNQNGWVTHSWDFGTPKALYVPDYQIENNSSIYTQYWQPYIRDRYDVNTRVAECKVLLKERVLGDWLRRFYYWDGCWWIMNKISDYNPCSDSTTKCEMVKVNEPSNYTK